jgi:pimeloyl-ACP methyl ester carboxylesterase
VLTLLTLFLLATVAAVAVDLATDGEERPATALYGGPFVRVGSTLVAYREWGRRGPPIVLLGGAAEPSFVWHAVGPLLAAAHHRVLAVDLPPFGYTERHGPYTLAGWVALLDGFERQLHVARPLLVGHSLGAGVAVGEALARPSDIRGVVLLDGDALRFGGGRSWLTHLLVFPWYPAAYRLLTRWDWLVGRVLRNAWGPRPPRFDHAFLEQFERPFRVSGTEGALRQLVANGIPGVTLADLRRVRVARAVLWGADDTVDSVASGRATARALGVPLRLVPEAGHLALLSRPRAVAALILNSTASRRNEP